MDTLFPFHPRFVHFPIAFSLVGAGFVIGGLLLQRRSAQDLGNRWTEYGRLSLVVGWVGVLAAIATGLIDQSSAPDDPQVTRVINQHITVGIGLLVALGLALYWPIRDRHVWTRRRAAFLALLIVVVVLVLLEAWLGGKLVYQFGVGVR